MEHASLLFFLALAVPGHALVRRWYADEAEAGLLGVLGLSWLLALALLSVVSIVCYVLRLPLAVFSVACVLAVAAGAVDLLRTGAGREAGRLVAGAAGLGLALLLADLFLSARAGAYLSGDALVHLGRIRFLLDHGLVNDDPYVRERFFFPVYHTSLHHALWAACAQVTRLDHQVVWAASAPFAKLLVLTGTYTLAWTCFRRRWVAWAAALVVVGHRGPVTFLLYPNQLAQYWLLPLALACVVRACAGRCQRRDVVLVAACALLLGQVHGLYSAFAVLALAPLLALRAGQRLVGRAPDAGATLACLGVLALSVLFPFVSKLERTTAGYVPPVELAAEDEGDAADEPFLTVGDGWIVRNPRRGFVSRPAVLGLFLVGAVLGLLGPARGRLRWVVAAGGLVAAGLFVPPLCTGLAHVIGRGWILGRLESVLRLAFLVLVPFQAAFLAERLLAQRVFLAQRAFIGRLARTLLLPGFAVVGALLAGHVAPFDWTSYLRGPAESPFAALRTLDGLRTALRAEVPPGSVVLANRDLGTRLVRLHDLHVVASLSGSIGVADQSERTASLREMLRDETEWPRRNELLARYGVTHLARERPARPWMADALAHVRLVDGVYVGTLAPAGPVPYPGDEPAYGALLLDVNRNADAVAHLKRAVAAHPDSFEARDLLARALLRTRDPAAAEASAREAARLRPADPGAETLLARTLLAQGRRDEAFAAFRRGLELQLAQRPDDATPALSVAESFEEMGATDAAEDALELGRAHAAERGDEDGQATLLVALGDLHARLGEVRVAADAYRRALALRPEDPSTRRKLAGLPSPGPR